VGRVGKRLSGCRACLATRSSQSTHDLCLILCRARKDKRETRSRNQASSFQYRRHSAAHLQTRRQFTRPRPRTKQPFRYARLRFSTLAPPTPSAPADPGTRPRHAGRPALGNPDLESTSCYPKAPRPQKPDVQRGSRERGARERPSEPLAHP